MTYTCGYAIQMNEDVTKNDFVVLCELLNEHSIFKDICTFEPEPITEGGIIFRFINWPEVFIVIFINLFRNLKSF